MRSLRLGVLVSRLLTATALASLVACGTGSIEGLFGPVADNGGVPGDNPDQQVLDSSLAPNAPKGMPDTPGKAGGGGGAPGDASTGSDSAVTLPDSEGALSDSAEPQRPGQGGAAFDGSSGHGGNPGSEDAAGPAVPDASVQMQADCRTACTSDCTHGTESQICRTCVDATCAALLVDLQRAPARNEYSTCSQSCRTNECFKDCCRRFPQACLATDAYGGCYCGYENPSCKGTCQSACTGGTVDQSCLDCLRDSPCAGGLYDYTYTANSDAFQVCRQSCGADSTCQKRCCTKYPEPCAARQNVVACACL